jgi:hypothetical protein
VQTKGLFLKKTKDFSKVFPAPPVFTRDHQTIRKQGRSRAGDSPPPGSFRYKGDCSPLLTV